MIIFLLIVLAFSIVAVILEEFENTYMKLTVLFILLLAYVYLTVIGGNFSG